MDNDTTSPKDLANSGERGGEAPEAREADGVARAVAELRGGKAEGTTTRVGVRAAIKEWAGCLGVLLVLGAVVYFAFIKGCSKEKPRDTGEEDRKVAFETFVKESGASASWDDVVGSLRFALQAEVAVGGRVVAARVSLLDIEATADGALVSGSVWVGIHECDVRLRTSLEIAEALISAGAAEWSGVYCAFRVRSVRHRMLGYAEGGEPSSDLSGWIVLGDMVAARLPPEPR